jgi:2'-5' RNA ligase
VQDASHGSVAFTRGTTSRSASASASAKGAWRGLPLQLRPNLEMSQFEVVEDSNLIRTGDGMHALNGVESGLVVLVPEADPVVGRWRNHLDRAAAEGLGAHITMLFPFAAPEQIDAEIMSRIAQVASATARLRFELTNVCWFGDHTVWLRAEPCGGVLELAERLQAAFTEYPRYGGAHDAIIPHLTIGTGSDLVEMRAAADAVAVQLPVRCEVTELSLVVRDSTTSRWKVGARFPLTGRVA